MQDIRIFREPGKNLDKPGGGLILTDPHRSGHRLVECLV
jgi:hypothetical protein